MSEELWKKRFEQERRKRLSECYSCKRSLVFDSHRGTYDTKNDRDATFRCYECGRTFCSECAPEHFGMEP